MTRPRTLLLLFFLTYNLSSFAQRDKGKDYWVLIVDKSKDACGYRNQNGDTVIEIGKYNACFTDTFRTYAILLKPNVGIVAINRRQKVLYNVLAFENRPDHSSDGLFRILKNDKIGYADSATGKIIVKPKFDCAFAFENGIAQVSKDCYEEKFHDGHIFWGSHSWFYIDKTGRRVNMVEAK